MIAKLERDDFAGLVQAIEVARNRKFIEQARNAIVEFLTEIKWENAVAAVSRLTGLETIPSNVPAALEKIWSEYRQQTAVVSDWLCQRADAAQEDYCTPEEHKAFWATLREALKYYQTHVVAFGPDGTLSMATRAKWEAAGCPKHWKPPSDYMCHNPRYENACDRSIRLKDDSLVNYYNNFREALIAA